MLPVSGDAGFVQQCLHPQHGAQQAAVNRALHVVFWYLLLVMKDQIIPFKTRIGILEVFSCSTCYAFLYLPPCKVFLTLSELFHLSLWQ